MHESRETVEARGHDPAAVMGVVHEEHHVGRHRAARAQYLDNEGGRLTHPLLPA
jgi:hypothetical protein